MIYKNKEFICVQHFAYHSGRHAGEHIDFRFEMPTGNLWESFVTKKEIPLDSKKRIMLIRTRLHNREDALTTKPITSGYGEGTYKLFDKGKCDILEYSPSHIVLDLKGKKIKGIYHLIKLGVINKQYKQPGYLFFKSNKSREDLFS